MPGVFRLTVDKAVDAAKQAADLGIPALALFPNTPQALKDDKGTEAVNPDNLVCRTLRAIRATGTPIGLLCDAAPTRHARWPPPVCPHQPGAGVPPLRIRRVH